MDLRDTLTGAMLRALIGLRDVGEAIRAKIKSVDGATIDTDGDKDVLVHVEDALTQHPQVARLFIPMNLLWAKPDEDEDAVMLRARDTEGPGSALLLYGDAGAAIPSWFAEKVGLWHARVVRVESDGDDVEIVAADDKKVKLGGDSGLQKAVVGDDLDSYLGEIRSRINDLETALNSLKTSFNAHQHPETGVTTGVPVVPSTAVVPGALPAADVLSDVVQIKK